jgi:hypothetical protein
MTDISAMECVILGSMITVMIVFGGLMWFFGKRSEIKSAAQYNGNKGETGA